MEYTYITEQQQANDELQQVTDRFLYFDTETTSLDPHNGKLRLLQLYTTGKPVIVIDLFKCRDITPVQELFAQYAIRTNTVCIGQGMKFDLKFFLKYDIPIDFQCYDTMLAEQLIISGQTGMSANLSSLEMKYLRLQREKDRYQRGGWFAPILTTEQIEYAAQNAYSLEGISKAQETVIENIGLWQALRIELACLPAFAEMEYAGIPVDEERLIQNIASVKKLQALYESKVRMFLGVDQEFNLYSTTRMVPVLQKHGISVQNTQIDTLRNYAFEHEWIQWYIKCKKARTLLTRTLPGLHTAVNRTTHCIHPTFFQVKSGDDGTLTGRPSASNPNVFGIDKIPQARGNIVAPEGFVLIDSDYEQMELRVIADITNDAVLLDMFDAHIDPYTETAKLAGVYMESDHDRIRKVVKQIALGITFGMGAKTLALQLAQKYGIVLSVQEAQDMYNTILASWPGVQSYHRTIKQQQSCETRTLSGRRRILTKFYFPKAVNSPVQGTAADIIKIALSKTYCDLKAIHGRVLLPVYDELVSICPVDTQENAVQIQEQAMIWAGTQLLHTVKLRVKTTSGTDWFQCSQGE